MAPPPFDVVAVGFVVVPAGVRVAGYVAGCDGAQADDDGEHCYCHGAWPGTWCGPSWPTWSVQRHVDTRWRLMPCSFRFTSGQRSRCVRGAPMTPLPVPGPFHGFSLSSATRMALCHCWWWP